MAVLARFRGDQDGANAVEFALLLPILIVLLFGILFGGIVLNHHLSVTQAAREGARFGATLPVPVGEDGDAEPGTTWFSRVRDRTLVASAGTLGGEAEIVCIWFLPREGADIPDGDNDAACPDEPPGEVPAGDQGNRVVVYAERPAVLEFVLYSFDTTLRGRAIARHEGGIAETEVEDPE